MTWTLQKSYISISQETCELSPLPSENPQASQLQGQRKDEVLPCIPECQFLKPPKAVSEEPKTLEIKPNRDSFTKQNQLKFSAVQNISGYSRNIQFKRRPILSATVTKLKPTCTRENQTETNKPKAKRCLHRVAGECDKITDNREEKDAFHSYLPVIDPVVSKSKSCRKVTTPSSRTRKRKSEGNGDDGNVTVTAAEHLDLFAYKTPNSKTKERTKRLVPVAKSNLTFIRPLKTDIPRHPMPFAAKNMFYDERWKEKQQQGFTWWLNFILTPDDFTVKTDVSEVNAAALLLGVESQHKRSVPRAPTKEETSLRAYAARCRLNGLRRAACRLFTSERMVKAIKKLEIEIEARRLAVRKDRHLWKDVGERQKVLNWLLSYNPLWLRIGLETVYGELIALEDNSDVMGMAVFILNRLLWNPDIAAEHRHPTVPHLYREGHEEALSKFTLKKLLLLVCFLDYAKTSRLIDHDPCLFCKDAEFKTSKEILLAFSRDFLSGEGDLSRHLSLLGLPVNHVQTPFDEFDFSVTNLAVDLQCGVRLVRTVELLTRSWDLSKQLRVPAISRLQKMHNVGLALELLRSRGVQLDDEHGNAILAKDIVDRHREKTLALLWKMALAFQVDISLNLDQLKEEIDFLKRTWSLKRTPSALPCRSDAVLRKKTGTRKSGPLGQRSESVKLLLDWADAVCAFYNKDVENFTVSFSDGRALCYLIHHYHPCYVPLDAICQRTTQTVDCAQTGSVVLNSSSESDESCLDVSLKALDHEDTSELYKELLENEKKNFQLVRSAVRDLGGIPTMIHHSDMSNTIPDEKVVITYLSFLCARLLDLRRETRAARLIQTTWRKYKLRTDLKRQQEGDRAARIIQSAVIRFLTERRLQREVNAALVIQKHWRRFSEQRKLVMLKKEELEAVQNQSALVIQKYWRSYSTRKRFLKLKYYSIILQSRIRMTTAVASYKRHLWAAVTIQRHWRACLRRNRDRQRYQRLKSSSRIIQSTWRRWRRRKTQAQIKAAVTLQRAFREWHVRTRANEEKAALVIQSWFRMHRESRKYVHIRSCVVLIQTRFRCFRARKLYKRKRESVLTLQKYFRAHLKAKAERAQAARKRAAAVRLQAAFRGMKARALRRQIRAVCVLQSTWRMRRERFRFLNLKKMVIKLQARVRKRQQLQRYQKVKKAALVIQVHFRAYVSARKVLASYQETRAAAIVLQSAYRGMRARKRFKRSLTSVIKIQSCYRAYVSRKKFLSLKHATVKLQSIVKMKQTRKQYLRVRAAALLIQQWYRSIKMAARETEHRQVQESCIKLQAFVRGHLARKRMRLQRQAATSLQSYFRMRRMRQDYLKICKAAVVIQNAYRGYRARANRRRNSQVERAATCLQAAYRGCKVRRLIRQQSAAALKIQTAFRGYSQRVKYQTALRAAVKIQRWYRTHKAACDARTRFLKTRAAVISLQSACRGWSVREQIRRERQAAVRIQSAFRTAKAGTPLGMPQAPVTPQQQCGGSGERRRAALALRSTWRRETARRQIRKQHEGAVIIQSYYRMYAQRKRWRAMSKAARLIQTCYGAYRAGRAEHRRYLETKAAAVALQSANRSPRVRRTITECDGAAATPQSRHAARRAAAVIQRWYRTLTIARHQRQEYLRLKKSAIKIQAVYRGIRVRRHIQRMHKAATFIKATFKMHQSRLRYHNVRTAAIVIQERYRAYYQGKAQRAEYLATLKATTVLQASFRGARVRQRLRKMQMAATLIQSCYRRYRQQTRFNTLKKAAKAVQQRYRALKAGNADFQRYSKLRRSVICIQAVFRGLKTRRQLRVMHLAAALIQRTFRTLMARRRFLARREAAVGVQRKCRANVCAQHRLQRLRLQTAAIKIQRSYRRWAVSKRLRERPRERHRAAAAVQAAFGTHRALVSGRALRRACPPVRRRSGSGSGSRGAAELPRDAAVTRARPAGGAAAAREGATAGRLDGRRGSRAGARGAHEEGDGAGDTAAGAVQRGRRGRRRGAPPDSAHTGRRACVAGPRAGGSAASLRRGRAGPAASGGLEGGGTRGRASEAAAATARPPAWRRLGTATARSAARSRVAAPSRGAGRRRERDSAVPEVAASKPDTQVCAAPRVRSWLWVHPRLRVWPCLRVRPWLRVPPSLPVRPSLRVRSCPRVRSWLRVRPSLRVRPCLRVAACGRRLREQRTAPVTATASAARSLAARQTLNDLSPYLSPCGAAAPSLQSRHGAHLPAKHQRGLSLPTLHNIVIIQAGIRGFLQKRKFQKIKNSALKIQAVWRGRKARKYVCEMKAACKIQAWYRGWKARKEYLAVLKAVKIIQGCFRTKLERTRFLKVRASAIIIQRKWRATLSRRTAREHFLMMNASEQRARTRPLRFSAAAYHHLSALRIQRAYKRHVALRDAERHIDSIVCIQRWFRARLQLKRFKRLCHSVVKIRHEAQECTRAALVIQKAVRHFLLRKKRERFRSGIIKIQALWRGYSWRKNNDCTKIKAIRSSLHVINGEVREEDRLYRRTALALQHLLAHRHLSAILEALQHLEVVTRLSPLCCENMAQSGAVSKIFVLIRSCNRSVPCMEVISCAVQVLLNVAKYEKTTWAVYDVDSCVETLLELLQTYRAKPGDRVADKSASIFTRTCCLLAVLLKTASRASDVRNRSKVVDCVCGLYKLTARKHRPNTERILYKQNKNSSVSPPFIPETPVRTIVSRLKPDWVLRKDSVEITSPLQAIQMLMDTLGVPYQQM
ncbi:abnormal spindle-like microcephaly-associated protein [Pteropus medius]|uniref:abnormal spindle-like microcephaly-associated protein n=1 Tax=Pteropus vampyrus TaxID=132908 RepID=UPI00196BB100|nr:abnormal spindle-like microcephaly-associated protein [Pteropus giganteus]